MVHQLDSKMVNILILYPKSDIAKSGKFPCVTASPQKEKTVMSRFEISQKSKGLLLRETESRHSFMVKMVEPTSILCFTQDTNKLNIDIISSDSMNFITDFECYGVLGLYHLSGGMKCLFPLKYSSLFGGHYKSRDDWQKLFWKPCVQSIEWL